jgi:hypothetical protein
MTRKYILKPGKHQFAPHSPAVHENATFSDEEAEWYLQRYPHIAGLFLENPIAGVTKIPGKPAPELNEPVSED